MTITPEQAAERSISLYLDVDHPGYVKEYGTYGYGRLLRNEKLGDRPFFETIKLGPGKAIEGAVVGPEGVPVAGVKISAYCTRPKPAAMKDASDLGRFTWTKTGTDGRFHLDLYPSGPAVFWVLPRDYALETHVLGNDQRGDLGTITLARGNTIVGKILDAQGKPANGSLCFGGSRPDEGTGRTGSKSVSSPTIFADRWSPLVTAHSRFAPSLRETIASA